MARNAPLPKAEAKVVVRPFGTEDWRDALDFDPVMIPVEFASDAGPLTTDVFNESVMTVVEAIIEAETGYDLPKFEFALAWSDTGYMVKGTCPVCDDVFPVSEGFTHDVPEGASPFGTCAVQCGCVDD